MEQSKIIKNVNDYLKWRGLPIQLDKEGVCHGLSSVYCKYVLENKEEEFYEFLEYLGEKQPELGHESAFNAFVQEIILSFDPEVFDKSLSQSDSLMVLNMNNKPLEPALQFAGVNSVFSWPDIFEEIALAEGEVMLVSSPNHTVALRKDRDGYYLYDPNIGEAPNGIENEDTLLEELMDSFSAKKNDLFIPLSIQLVRHPEANPRSLPTPEDLYANHFDGVVNQGVTLDQQRHTNLALAAEFNNPLAIETLLDMGASDYFEAAQTAVIYNNSASLSVLLNKITGEDECKRLLLNTIDNGRFEAFSLLAQKDKFKSLFNGLIKQNNLDGLPLLNIAAAGGNERILEEIVTRSREVKSDAKVAEQIFQTPDDKLQEKDAIQRAIESGSVPCVRCLMDKVVDHNQIKERAQRYIQSAIDYKQPIILSYLLKALPKEQLTAISMSDEGAEKTSICILKTLDKHHMLNSPKAIEMLASAKSSAVNVEAIDKYAYNSKFGFKLQDLVTFLSENPFTQFLKEKFNNTRKAFNSFKEQFIQIKTAAHQKEVCNEEPNHSNLNSINP